MGRYMLCCFLMITLYPVGIDLYLVALPNIGASLQASEAQLHTAFSLYLLGMAATVPLAGLLADRHGRRPVILSGAGLFMLASLLAGSADDTAQFLLARVGQGAGAGALYIMTFTVLRDVLPPARLAAVLSAINGVICVIPVLAPLLGYLILTGFPWPAIFQAMALLGGVVLLINLLGLKESLPLHPEPSSSASAARFAFLRVPQFLWMCALSSAGMTCILTYVSTSPMILMTQRGLATAEYARIMMIMAMISMITSFLAPWLLRRLHKHSLLALAHSGLGLALLLILASHLESSWGLWLLQAGFAFTCIGFSASFGIAMGEALASCRYQIALASATLCLAQITVSAGYIWLMGWLGFAPSTLLACALLGAVLLYLLFRALGPAFDSPAHGAPVMENP
ncbi:TPA: MdtL family multidrug efflux MFS transporter [Aeromonas hydrophila]